MPSSSPVIFVHGSWGGPWVWDALIDAAGLSSDRAMPLALKGISDGYNPNTTPDVHVAQVAETLAQLTEPATLVGHSYGGLIVTAAAARSPDKVARVIVLDGFIAATGRSIFDDYPAARGMMEPAFTDDPEAAILPAPAAAFGADDAAAAVIDAKSVPMPQATHEQPVSQDMSALSTLARDYVLFTGFPVFAETAENAAAAGWTVHALDLGHFAPVSDAPAVAAALNL